MYTTNRENSETYRDFILYIIFIFLCCNISSVGQFTFSYHHDRWHLSAYRRSCPLAEKPLKKHPTADIIDLVRFRRDEDGKRKILYSS